MHEEKKGVDSTDPYFSHHSANSGLQNKRILLIGSIIAAALIVDVLITWLFDMVHTTMQGSSLGLAVFVATAAIIHGASQYFLLSIVRQFTQQVRKKISLYNILFWSVIAIEFILVALYISIILEILLSARYYTAWSIAATALSMAATSTILAFQSYTFVLWFRIHTKNFVVMVYALAPALASIGVGMGAFRSFIRFLEGPTVIEQSDKITFQLISSFGQYHSLFYLSVLVLLASYMLFWIGSVLHLRNYSKKRSRVKYWLLALIPAVAFPTTLAISIGAEASVSTDDSDQSASAESVIMYRVVAILSALASFIMNGFVYFMMSKNVHATTYGRTSSIQYYLLFAGFGVMTLGISIAVPTFATFPPFESVPRSFMSVASYLYSIGLYSSAISLAEDTSLRQSIRKLAFESRLLDGIGKAQMEVELQNKVLAITKTHSDSLAEKTGIESSLSEQDVKDYLEQILEELRSSKKGNQQDDN
jgi:hypothetical protein